MDTLPSFFAWVLAASLRASLVTVVVLTLRWFLRHRLPASWRSFLWLPVLVVLLMPAFPESRWSVSSITRLSSLDGWEQDTEPLQEAPSAKGAHVSQEKARQALPGWREGLLTLWLAGVVGMLIFGLLSYLYTLRRIRRGCLTVSQRSQRELHEVCAEIGLRRMPRIWISPQVGSPAVTGLLRPLLLLPAHFEEAFTEEERQFVLKHELLHIKRGDLFVNALLCLLLALHWFNPVLWIAYFRARHDREMACDAQVLAGEEQPRRIAYGHTLLKIETTFPPQGLCVGFVGILERGAMLRERISSIAAAPSVSLYGKAAVSLAVALLAFAGVTQGESKEVKNTQVLIEAKFVELPAKTAELPALLKHPVNPPGVVGTVTEAQLQEILRDLSQRKGVDLLAAPRVTTRDGQRADIEIKREVSYKDAQGKPLSKDCGISLSVVPELHAEGLLELDLKQKLMECDGVVKHDNGWNETLFSERNVEARLRVKSGECAVLELEPRTDKQLVQEVDENDKILSSDTVLTVRRTLIFVTARVVKAPEPK